MFSEVFLRIENRIVKELSAVVTVVEGVVSHMEKMGVKTVLVKNYPDIESLPSPAEWSIKANQICYVGDFTRIRGLFEIITSMSEIEAQLIVAGRWSDRSLKEDLDNLGIPPNVSDLGFVTKNQVQEIFRDSKVGLVLFHPAPNHLDALPNKLFEYLAAGIPVVASNFGWLKKIVEDYDCGIAVDPLNQSEIIKAVNTLLQDQETARKMGENGRQAVLSYFNWETEKMKLVSLYQALL